MTSEHSVKAKVALGKTLVLRFFPDEMGNTY